MFRVDKACFCKWQTLNRRSSTEELGAGDGSGGGRRRRKNYREVRLEFRILDAVRSAPGIALPQPQDPDSDIALSSKCVSASSELTKWTAKTGDRDGRYNIDRSTALRDVYS
jgi:hypothetical protein